MSDIATSAKDIELYTLTQEIKRLKHHNAQLQHELTMLERSNAALEEFGYAAYHDYLTKLPNRMLFEFAVSNALTHSKRWHKMTSIMFIDLDGFKNINDSLGHEVGDQLLKHVAKRFQTTLREEDLIARLGGDEFGVLIKEIRTINDLDIIAEKLIRSLASPFQLLNNTIHITSSIGIAVYPTAGLITSELIKNADTAMYQAKKAGKNTFRRWMAI